MVVEIPRLSAGGLQQIKDWIAAARNPRPAVVDVLMRVRDPHVLTRQIIWS